MNIDHLKLFVRLANTHNISSAGKELGLSPAVASSYLNKLELELGTRLLNRTTRKVSLTEQGQAFLPHALDVLDQVEAARASVGVGKKTPQGTLRIAAPASFGRMHIQPALKAFLEKFPDLTLDLRLSDTMVNLVEGGFDIAIRNAALHDSTLIARKLAPDTRILVASPDYLKKHGEPESPQDLTAHWCVNLIGLENWVFSDNGKSYSVRPTARLRVDDGQAMRDACIDGLGISVCSTWIAYQALENGELVQVLKDYQLTSDTDIWAVYPSARLLAPKVRAFIDFFAERFGDKPYWDKI
ncbi:LysR family transcriptional regulator [Thalassotalea litorea]|uniref:LysR family transcriptional regulator n=1 Tax=Thalassotalea litorea TaxID=2020715 RepID=A0A5R9ICC5_9GAMM|nr:LysR family transcriptional regulator [Thalassotalea litorea]TLU61023.1 LysR family transcriptional regulator [Thalassotalea litorea]